MVIYPSLDEVLLYSISGTANQNGYSFSSAISKAARCHVSCVHVFSFFFTILNGLLFFIIENVIITLVLRISADDFIRSKCYVLYVIKVNLLILNMNR